MIYQTHDGDVLDAICAVRYGTENLSARVTQVLEANPGLADKGAVLAAGVTIRLPELVPVVAHSPFNLWD